jgi:general secretion pathway protein C
LHDRPEPSAARPSLPTVRDRTWASRQGILDRNRFDSSTLAPAPPVQRPEPIEKSQLPVALLGTFAANNASLSRATLHDRESQETLVVGIGDEIEDQALIVQIERERVVLRENGATREITLDEADHGTSQWTGSSPSASSTRAPAPTEGPVRRSDEYRFGTSPSESEQAILAHVLSQARVLPKFEDGGQMVGLEVSMIQAGSLFEEIEMEDGDVITEFNGIPMDSQAKSVKVLQEMADADEYHVVGRRPDGSEQVWDFVPED